MVNIYNEILEIIPQKRVLKDEPMSKHTSLKIGGPADMFIKVNNLDELINILNIVKKHKLPLTVIGNGTNLLVKDKGIRGITIKLYLNQICFKGDEIEADAGVTIPVLAKKAYDNGLSGLEFASGIPGTLGGAIKMNAGAYGGEIKDIVLETTYLDKDLNLRTISNKEHNFSYRHSVFEDTEDIIICTRLKLSKGNKENIKNKMEENLLKRKEKQPLDFPNAGSIFKRKNEYIVAQIIDKCGLKGYNIGDAYISEKHAGFIINKGAAKAEDVIKLIEHIKAVINKEYNIDLELEIKVIGE